MGEKNRQLVIALAIYLAFILLFDAANLLSAIGERDGTFETRAFCLHDRLRVTSPRACVSGRSRPRA